MLRTRFDSWIQLGVVLLLSVVFLVGGSPVLMQASADFRIEPDLEYTEGPLSGGRSKKLFADAYLPIGRSGPHPAVLLLHGGGFRRGSRVRRDAAGGFSAAGF